MAHIKKILLSTKARIIILVNCWRKYIRFGEEDPKDSRDLTEEFLYLLSECYFVAKWVNLCLHKEKDHCTHVAHGIKLQW